MSERKFNIVFDGSVINGSDLLEVKARVRALFKLDEAATEKLFTGSPLIIKKNVDRKTAIQFQTAMTKAGAKVQLIMHKEKDLAPPPAVAPDNHSSESNSSDNQSTNHSTRDENDASEQTANNNWTVAAPGSPILSAQEKQSDPIANIKTDHIELEKNSSNPFLDKLDAAEKQPLGEPTPNFPTPDIKTKVDFEFKSEDQIESENQARESHTKKFIEEQKQRHQENFDIADVGEDLLSAQEKTEFVELEIDISHLNIEPTT